MIALTADYVPLAFIIIALALMARIDALLRTEKQINGRGAGSTSETADRPQSYIDENRRTSESCAGRGPVFVGWGDGQRAGPAIRKTRTS